MNLLTVLTKVYRCPRCSRAYVLDQLDTGLIKRTYYITVRKRASTKWKKTKPKIEKRKCVECYDRETRNFQ